MRSVGKLDAILDSTLKKLCVKTKSTVKWLLIVGRVAGWVGPNNIRSKINQCEMSLRNWIKKKKSEWNKEMKNAKARLAEHSNANNPRVWEDLKRAEDIICCLLENDEVYWRQSSRAL